jgi:mannose-6-phosphate isomerase-like protein (cupin superfamily)
MNRIPIASLLLLFLIEGKAQSKLEEVRPSQRVINAFDLAKENAQQNRNYGVFMRMPSMSSGVYTLKKGAKDEQVPHTRDETYYIISGKAKIKVGKESYLVTSGSLVFVEAYKEHRFYDIDEDLTIVVVFGAEQTRPATNK